MTEQNKDNNKNNNKENNEEIKKIIQKYNLPPLEELFKELGNFDVKETDDFIELIIKKLEDKVSHYIKFLEDMLQPDSSIYAMHESSMFNNEERKQMLTILKKLIYQDRLYLKLEINSSEETKSDYFKNYLNVWNENKKLLLPFIEKAISVWKKDNDDVEFEAYFG
jgi:hypothetical protein